MTKEKELLIQQMQKESTLPISADTYATFEAYNSIIDSSNSDEISHLLFYKGVYFFRTGDFNQALDYFNRCIHAPKSNNLKIYDALSHNAAGLIHSYLNQEVIANDEYSKCIRICKSYHLDRELIIAYINLGYLYFSLDNYTRAIEYEEMAFSLIEDNSKTLFHLKLICLGYQGMIHSKSGNSQKALEIYQQIEALQKEHDDFYFDASIRNLAIRTAYYQNDEEKFQEHLSKFLQFANSREDFLLSSEFYIDICGLLLDADRKEESRLILDHMNNCTKDFPQAFLRFYVQRLETEYAKKFCPEEIYLETVSQLLDLFSPYDEELLSAKNYTLEHIEHIHKTKSLSSQLEEKSKLDPMTNLLNKYTVQFFVEEYLDEMDESNISALLIIDMDHFKQINDTLGHLIGDSLLTEVAADIQHYFNDDCFCGRIGGDEFLVFIKHVDDTSTVLLHAELLRQKIYKKITERNISITVHASMGIAFTSNAASNFEALFAAADNALYQAKKDGRNRLVIYE